MTVVNPGGGVSTPAFAFGTAAARPAAAAGNNATAYYATDTGEVTFSNGAAWSNIKSLALLTGIEQSSNFAIQIGQAGFPVLNVGGPGVYGVVGGVDGIGSNDFSVRTAGRGLRVAEGANSKQGTAVLVAGTVTVANTSVTANSRILLTSQADGGTVGFLRVSARVAGTSFTITSSNAADTSTVAYEIFEPG